MPTGTNPLFPIPISIALSSLLVACSGIDNTASPAGNQPLPNTFSDDFESAATFLDLFPDDGSGWTNVQLVAPDGDTDRSISDTAASVGANLVELHDDGGDRVVRCYTPASGSAVSKADLERGGFAFGQGDEFWAAFDIKVSGSDSYQSLLIFDLEATGLGSAGRRLQMTGGDNILMLESEADAFGPDYRQTTPVPFPKGSWVRIVVHMQISAGDDGLVEVWQDGVKIIEGHGQNLYSSEVVYDQVQLGITANASDTAKEVFIDDVVISSEAIATGVAAQLSAVATVR